MEDFSLARAEECPQASGLQAEWLESNLPKSAARIELAMAVTRQDKPDGPGKDVADRLDKELRDFATAKPEHPSADMQDFQKMIAKFCDNPDKTKAMEELGNSYGKLNVQIGKDAEKTYDELQAEGAKQPGRSALQADYNTKFDSFFNKVDALPQAENSRVTALLSWNADTESKDHHEEVVRKGLANNKDLLASYNSMEEASDKIDANKSPLEKELEATHTQQIRDLHTMKPQVDKAYIRSTISC